MAENKKTGDYQEPVFPRKRAAVRRIPGKGYLISLAQIATIAGLVETTLMSIESQHDYDDAKDDYYQSTTQDMFDERYRIVEDTYDEAQQAQTLRLISAGAAAAVYLYNVIDAALNGPKREDRFGKRSLHIEPRITRNYSTITVSFKF